MSDTSDETVAYQLPFKYLVDQAEDTSSNIPNEPPGNPTDKNDSSDTKNVEVLKKAEKNKLRTQYEEELARLEADFERRRLDFERQFEIRRLKLKYESDLAEKELNDLKHISSPDSSYKDNNVSPTVNTRNERTNDWAGSQVESSPMNIHAQPFNPRENVQSMLLKLNLLQGIEPTKFSGEPHQFPVFRKQLIDNLEDGLLSDSQKIEFLPKFLCGEALDVMKRVKGCDYNTIIKTLEKRYGHPAKVAAAVLKNITTGDKLAQTDYVGLMSLSEEIQAASNILIGEYAAEASTLKSLSDIMSRFPNYINNKWAERCFSMRERDHKPMLNDLSNFISEQALIKNDPSMLYSSNKSAPSNYPSKYNKGQVKRTTTMSTSIQNNYKQCVLCKKPHNIWSCSEFDKMTIDKRWDVVKVNKLCHCCLRSGHTRADCNFQYYCNCSTSRKHHKLLHNPIEKREAYRSSSVKNTENTGVKEIEQFTTGVESPQETILLHVGAVKIISPEGRSVTTYGLFDNASRATVMSKNIENILKLKGKPEEVTVKTVIGNKLQQFRRVHVNLKCAEGKGHMFPVEALVSDNFNISERILPHNIEIKSHFSESVSIPEVELKEISVLIGKNVQGVFEVLEVEKTRVENCMLEAQRGPLGWIVTGTLFCAGQSNTTREINFLSPATSDIANIVENFWKIDSAGSKLEQSYSIQDKRALDLLENNTVLNDNGHYETGLLWSSDDVCLPDNKFEAEKRYNSLMKKFEKDSEFETLYRKTMQDYISKGYARKLSREESESRSNKTWYLPHFAVSNVNKPGKLRIVFDAAANLTGTFLNKHLLSGVDQTNSLLGVLLRFREHEVALCADIQEFFMRVAVPYEDQDALRFLWSESSNIPPDIYATTVHIFGATDSPCAANFCLRKLATDNENICSKETIDCILKQFYVDDLISSFSTPEKAIEVGKELIRVCENGGFKLTKFMSTDKSVLDSLPNDNKLESIKNLDMNNSFDSRALGVGWNTENDTFGFRVNGFKSTTANTMRGAMSSLCRIFDPLGMAAPFVFRGKIILQELWRRKISWDDELPSDILNCWLKWKNDIEMLKSIELSRTYFTVFNNICEIQIHHFCDASEQGYAAVTYLRAINSNYDIELTFVIGKSRNAPIKAISIPRLELQAAVLAVRLDNLVKSELTLNINQTFFWTDSEIVLNYINNETKRFKTYIANRVTEIRDSSDPSQWRHVPGVINPADECTRSNSSYSFEEGNWLSGPTFLYQCDDQWPDVKFDELPNDMLEIRKDISLNFIQTDSPILDLVNYYSDLKTLLRSIAWIIKFILWLKSSKDNRKLIDKQLSLEDIQVAQNRVISLEQNRIYSDEINTLKTHSHVKPSSHIVKLKPILVQELLCVGGRLINAPISEKAKHPIILPQKSNLTIIIVRNVHEQNGHCGHEEVLAILREKYWIVKARTVIKKVLNSCFKCKKLLAPKMTQEMANLPKSRLTPYESPFTYSGVDYFGPFMVKRSRKVNEKRYGVIFVCFNSRAVHLELAKSLETDDFILVLLRFLNRRGYVKEIRSDNGSNFIGAEREIGEAIRNFNKDKLNKTLFERECKWIFQTPTASHSSGVWERLVKVVKRSLKSILGNEPFNEEILTTVFTEAERIANNRPLVRNPTHPDDFEALTPNHFLNIRPSTLLPPNIVCEKDKFSRKRWRQVQLLSDHYWKRWLREYIPTLQQRHKWNVLKRNLSKNDVVLVVEDNAPRNDWLLGLVIEIYPGSDGLVRSVTVRTKNGELKRPINKLCLLEACDSDM